MKTKEVMAEVLAGKLLSLKSRECYKFMFAHLGAMYEEFPTKRVEVNKWLASMSGYADATVKLRFSLLREACKYMDDNYGVVSPCKGIAVPKVRKLKRRYFNVEEIMKIMQACSGAYELALVTTLIDSTCRIGELASLKVEGVGDGWLDVKGKTGERRYRLDARLCEGLRRLGGDGDTVFGVSVNALKLRVIRICKRAGITGKKLGAHTLRHSSASLVASETKNVMAVKALLQHDDIATSMVYIHDVEEELQKGISPLKLVADRLKDSGVKQLPMVGTPDGDGVVEVVEVVDEVEAVDDLLIELYPDIDDGVSVRPLLKTEDLRLIRAIMLGYARSNGGDVVHQRGRELLKRLLRRVK